MTSEVSIAPKALDELSDAFEAWASEHGLIWFNKDRRLAEAIARVLGTDLVWGIDDDDA